MEARARPASPRLVVWTLISARPTVSMAALIRKALAPATRSALQGVVEVAAAVSVREQQSQKAAAAQQWVAVASSQIALCVG